MTRRRSLAGGAAAAVVVLAAAASAFLSLLDGAAALHLCTDRLFNDTQGRHSDGLPHLNQAEEATWMGLLPRRAGPRDELDWLALYRSITRGGGDVGGEPAGFLSPASLHDVRVDPYGANMYWQGQQTNLEYLLYLDPDRLTWTFRQQAKLPTVGEPYGGWEAPDGQLRGHFTGLYHRMPFLISSCGDQFCSPFLWSLHFDRSLLHLRCLC
jgi:hypothetical protein